MEVEQREYRELTPKWYFNTARLDLEAAPVFASNGGRTSSPPSPSPPRKLLEALLGIPHGYPSEWQDDEDVRLKEHIVHDSRRARKVLHAFLEDLFGRHLHGRREQFIFLRGAPPDDVRGDAWWQRLVFDLPLDSEFYDADDDEFNRFTSAAAAAADFGIPGGDGGPKLALLFFTGRDLRAVVDGLVAARKAFLEQDEKHNILSKKYGGTVPPVSRLVLGIDAWIDVCDLAEGLETRLPKIDVLFKETVNRKKPDLNLWFHKSHGNNYPSDDGSDGFHTVTDDSDELGAEHDLAFDSGDSDEEVFKEHHLDVLDNMNLSGDKGTGFRHNPTVRDTHGLSQEDETAAGDGAASETDENAHRSAPRRFSFIPMHSQSLLGASAGDQNGQAEAISNDPVPNTDGDSGDLSELHDHSQYDASAPADNIVPSEKAELQEIIAEDDDGDEEWKPKPEEEGDSSCHSDSSVSDAVSEGSDCVPTNADDPPYDNEEWPTDEDDKPRRGSGPAAGRRGGCDGAGMKKQKPPARKKPAGKRVAPAKQRAAAATATTGSKKRARKTPATTTAPGTLRPGGTSSGIPSTAVDAAALVLDVATTFAASLDAAVAIDGGSRFATGVAIAASSGGSTATRPVPAAETATQLGVAPASGFASLARAVSVGKGGASRGDTVARGRGRGAGSTRARGAPCGGARGGGSTQSGGGGPTTRSATTRATKTAGANKTQPTPDDDDSDKSSSSSTGSGHASPEVSMYVPPGGSGSEDDDDNERGGKRRKVTAAPRKKKTPAATSPDSPPGDSDGDDADTEDSDGYGPDGDDGDDEDGCDVRRGGAVARQRVPSARSGGTTSKSLRAKDGAWDSQEEAEDDPGPGSSDSSSSSDYSDREERAHRERRRRCFLDERGGNYEGEFYDEDEDPGLGVKIHIHRHQKVVAGMVLDRDREAGELELFRRLERQGFRARQRGHADMWPPADVEPLDLVFLLDRDLRKVLAPATRARPRIQYRPALPRDEGDLLATRVFLAFQAGWARRGGSDGLRHVVVVDPVKKTLRSSNGAGRGSGEHAWSLFALPVGPCMSARQRDAWLACSGGMAAHSATIHQLAHYVQETLFRRAGRGGRQQDAVFALLTPWFGSTQADDYMYPRDAVDHEDVFTADKTYRTWHAKRERDKRGRRVGPFPELFKKHTRRFGMALCVNRLLPAETGLGDDVFEILLYDPSVRPGPVRDSPFVAANKVAIAAYRAAVVGAVRAAIEECEGMVAYGWVGGRAGPTVGQERGGGAGDYGGDPSSLPSFAWNCTETVELAASWILTHTARGSLFIDCGVKGRWDDGFVPTMKFDMVDADVDAFGQAPTETHQYGCVTWEEKVRAGDTASLASDDDDADDDDGWNIGGGAMDWNRGSCECMNRGKDASVFWGDEIEERDWKAMCRNARSTNNSGGSFLIA